MVDIVSEERRSYIMSHVRSSGNKATELKFISFLKGHKITGWRRNQTIFGKPDFVFPQYKIAVFVDGCFWHGCPKHGTIPDTRKEYWDAKIRRNIQRDKQVSRTLRALGWSVMRIWQHDLTEKRIGHKMTRLRRMMEKHEMKKGEKSMNDDEQFRNLGV